MKRGSRRSAIAGFLPVLFITALFAVSGGVMPAHVFGASGGTFTAVGSMHVPRLGHTATLLLDGKVLIAGGDDSNNTAPYLSSAEIYDPATKTFAYTGNMTVGRGGHTATLLKNGKVLLAGGFDEYVPGHTLKSAELYDPATGTFTPTGDMNVKRGWHQAVLLDDGRVLMTGGYDNQIPYTGTYLTASEVYDPATGTFTLVGDMHDPRIWFSLVKLMDGRVLVAGGSDKYCGWSGSAELFDPSTNVFTPTGSLITGRWTENGVLLNNGKVLFAGGVATIGGCQGVNLSSAELYDAGSGTFSSTGDMHEARHNATATLLKDGSVLVAGGGNGSAFIHTAELYHPDTGTFESIADPMTASRYYARATLLTDGDVLLTGGLGDGSTILSSAELYVPQFICGVSRVADADGNTYGTTDVNGQCWMTENIRVGTMVPGTTEQSNNGTIEKYCYDNDPANCTTDGGLYQWDEAMQYSTTEGAQGICPAGWHIPTDAEFHTLENNLADPGEPCDATRSGSNGAYGWGCFPAGAKLLTGTAGMSVSLSGARGLDGLFYWYATNSDLWSSLQDGGRAWGRFLTSYGGWTAFDRTGVSRSEDVKAYGFSVRCIQGQGAVGPTNYDGVVLPAFITTDTTLVASNVPYIVQGKLTVTNHSTLTIQPGVVIKFATLSGVPGSIVAVTGWIRAIGKYGNPITFTTIADDSVGGDTNRDGATTAPGALDANEQGYTGIELQTADAYLKGEHIVFQYAKTALDVHDGAKADVNDLNASSNVDVASVSAGGSLQLAEGKLQYNDTAIRVSDGGSVNVVDSSFMHNAYGIVLATAPKESFLYNNLFVANTSAAIANSSVVQVHAASNWWGSNTGPRHISNPNGLGDLIMGNVDYSNWYMQVPMSIQNSTYEGLTLDDSCPLSNSHADNLVLITHGWRDVGTQAGWNDLRDKITAKLDNTWDVCVYNWGADSGRLADIISADPASAFPQLAWVKAAAHGVSLGNKLAKMNYKRIHFIAHSAGANLIQNATKTLVQQKGSAAQIIQTTFLDAYAPFGSEKVYGSDSNFSDQYVNIDSTVIDGPLGQIMKDTDHYLSQAFNVDVSLFKPTTLDPLFGGHGWPVTWYTNSITAGSKYGYGMSIEGRNGVLASHNEYPRGASCQYTSEEPERCVNLPVLARDTFQIVVKVANYSYYLAHLGKVTIDNLNPMPVLLQPESPAWVDYSVNLNAPADYVSFEYQFDGDTSTHDILTVFVDGELVYEMDQDVVGTKKQNAGILNIPHMKAGNHIIRFRVDPLNAASKGGLRFGEVAFGMFFEDSDAPTTTPDITGTLLSGATSTYIGATTIALKAVDNPGGVGVASTTYSLDHASWQTYASTSPLVVTAEGDHTIQYYSTDWFGNTETTKTLSFRIVSVKWYLDDAAAKLKDVHTGNRDIDTATAGVLKNLGKITLDKVWIDRNRLSWPSGLSTLIGETGVVKDLGDILNKAGQKKNNVPTATQMLYRDAQSDIVQSNALLARLSFDKAKVLKAKNAAGQKSLDKLIARVQKMLDRAAANETSNPKMAARLYGAAWFASEMLLKTSVAPIFRASDFGDLFSAEDMNDLMD